ncbi:MAG: hypothetical protein AAFQ58_22945 [Pseudomonadota bacterium]
MGGAGHQAEAMTFLVSAFIAVIFLMLVILVLQFNSFYQAFVMISAIVLSIAGVLLGLVVTGPLICAFPTRVSGTSGRIWRPALQWRGHRMPSSARAYRSSCTSLATSDIASPPA